MIYICELCKAVIKLLTFDEKVFEKLHLQHQPTARLPHPARELEIHAGRLPRGRGRGRHCGENGGVNGGVKIVNFLRVAAFMNGNTRKNVWVARGAFNVVLRERLGSSKVVLRSSCHSSYGRLLT